MCSCSGRLEAINGKFVAVAIAGISGIGIGAPVARTWCGTSSKSSRMECVDRGAVGRFEAHGDTITYAGGLPVGGL